MQVLVSVRLYLYKHMHAGTLMPHYLNQGKINAVSMKINYISLRPYQIDFMFHGSGRIFVFENWKKKCKNAINMYT